MTMKWRLISVITFLSVLAAGIGMLGLHGMEMANEGLKAVYEDRALVLERISGIEALMLRNRLSLSLAITDPTVDIKAESAQIQKNNAEIDSAWGKYMSANLVPEEKRLADKLIGPG